MKFGNRIQELRKMNNLSQEALADKVARQTISKWELNETSPDLKDSTKLCEIFNITLVLAVLTLVLLILSKIICMINSKSIEFWHTWNWFLN